MRQLPEKLRDAIKEISLLPGIGSRTALRLVLHLLKQPKQQIKSLADALSNLNHINYCKDCHNISDTEVCNICSNRLRDRQTICVVEDIRDMIAVENTGCFRGIYHILGGKISPMEGIGIQQLHIESLINKVDAQPIKEVILALSSTTEGDTTNFYLHKNLKEKNITISTIARGISIGDELEYTDEITLGNSINNRVPYQEYVMKI